MNVNLGGHQAEVGPEGCKGGRREVSQGGRKSMEDTPLSQHPPPGVACRLLPGVEMNWVPLAVILLLLVRRSKGLRTWWTLNLFLSIPGGPSPFPEIITGHW